MLHYNLLYGVWKAGFRVEGVDCDLTHCTKTRFGMRPASICSVPLHQKGRALIYKLTYHKENHKHYQIVNRCRTTSDPPDIPHDFPPCQPYLIFHRRDNKCGERNTNGIAYLVRQGQKEVIEEDGRGRNCIILVEIARSQPQTR